MSLRQPLQSHRHVGFVPMSDIDSNGMNSPVDKGALSFQDNAKRSARQC
jgi:hypothetical protein